VPRLSSRRSSTAPTGTDRLHRYPQGRLRDRADLPRARRARDQDRPVDLLRSQVQASLATRAARRRDRRGQRGRTEPTTAAGAVRVTQDVAAPTPAGPRRGPLHDRTALPPAGLGRRATTEEGSHHHCRPRGRAATGSGGPAVLGRATEPAVGSRLHLRRDLGRHGLRRLHLDVFSRRVVGGEQRRG
jgi:hypothetical protein